MDDNFDDYFTVDQPAEQPARRTETAQEREEREIAEVTIERRHNTVRIVLVTIVVTLFFALGVWVWLHYFHPFAQSQEKGYIMTLEADGALIKTFEGTMMSERLVLDTVIVYQEDFKFTVEDTAVARRAKQLAGLGRRVMVTYDRYAGRLPWQGRNVNVVTRIDTLEAR